VGGVLSLVGLGDITRQYRQGRLGRGELLTIVIGFVVLAGLAIGEVLLWKPPTWMPLASFFLPLWLGLIVFTRRRRRRDSGRSGDREVT
jgi:hypothetical protein